MTNDLFGIAASGWIGTTINTIQYNKINTIQWSYFCSYLTMLCVALKTSRYWSASIGLIRNDDGLYYAYIDANHWTTKLSYVCQYHSKSLHVLSLSVYQSVVSQWIE